MNPACRTHYGRVVELDRFEFAVVKDVSPGLVYLTRGSRRSETGRGHVQRTEYLALDHFFPRHAGFGFDDCAQQHETDIGIGECSDG